MTPQNAAPPSCRACGHVALVSITQGQRPERAIWWAKMEALALASKPSGAVFRSDRPSYQQMLDYSQQQANLFDADEEGIGCFCGD